MARINIEDEIHMDPRAQALVRKLGDGDKAIGMLYRFWHLAQKHWGRRGLIPEDEFVLGGFEPLLEVSLAEKRAGGYYAKGSQERFGWYLECCSKAQKAGKASAAARKLKYGSANPRAENREHREPDVNRTFTNREPDVNPLTLTLAPNLKETSDESAAVPLSGDFFVQLVAKHSHPPLKAKTVLMLSPKDRTKAHALLRDFPEPDYWLAVMKRAERSSYLCGQTDKPFRFTLSFLLQPHAHLKIMNGDYDDYGSAEKPRVKYEVVSE